MEGEGVDGAAAGGAGAEVAAEVMAAAWSRKRRNSKSDTCFVGCTAGVLCVQLCVVVYGVCCVCLCTCCGGGGDGGVVPEQIEKWLRYLCERWRKGAGTWQVYECMRISHTAYIPQGDEAVYTPE